MKVAAISDFHNEISKIDFQEADILAIAGDWTYMGSVEEISKFFFDLAQHKDKFQRIIGVAGNHDFLTEKQPLLFKSMIPEWFTYLEDSGILVEGRIIWGSPVTPFFYNWAWNRHRGEDIKRYWSKIPSDCDLLITHGPPMGILDQVPDGRRVGCEMLTPKVFQKKVKHHIFGHIHHSHGQKKVQDTYFYNVSMMDEEDKIVNPITEFEI